MFSNLLYNWSIMSTSKLLKPGFNHSVSCTPIKCLFKKNWSELFMNHQIDLSCSTPSTIVIGDSMAAGLAHFSDVWHNFHLQNRVDLIIKLPAIGLQTCKFTKNELLDTYFSRIFARFWVIIYCAFSRNHSMEGRFTFQ